jgi:prevent-host-death family protein
LAWLDGYGYNSYMKPVSVAYAKNNLSALLRKVRAGQTVTITDRGVAVARLVAPAPTVGIAPRFIELAQRGVVRLPDRQTSRDWYRGELPKPSGKLANDAVGALLEERRSGR